MRGTFRFVKPDDLEAMLTITMTLREWKELRSQLADRTWPSTRLSAMIANLILDAEKQFSESDKEAL